MGKPTTAQREAKANGADPTPPERDRNIDDYISELSGDDNRAEELAMEIAGYLALAKDLKREMRREHREPHERALMFGEDKEGDLREEVDVWDAEKQAVVQKTVQFRSYNEAFRRLMDSIDEAKAEAREIKKIETVEKKVKEAEKKLFDRNQTILDTQARGQQQGP